MPLLGPLSIPWPRPEPRSTTSRWPGNVNDTTPTTVRHYPKPDHCSTQSHQPAIRTVTTLVKPTTHKTPRRITPSHQVTQPRNSRCIRHPAKRVDLAVGAAPGRVRCVQPGAR